MSWLYGTLALWRRVERDYEPPFALKYGYEGAIDWFVILLLAADYLGLALIWLHGREAARPVMTLLFLSGVLIGLGFFYIWAGRCRLSERLKQVEDRLCLRCGYTLEQSYEDPRCPACGEAIEIQEMRERWSRWRDGIFRG